MKKTLITLSATLILLAQTAWAEMALTPETAPKINQVFDEFGAASEKYPEAFKDLNDGNDEYNPATQEGRDKLMARIISSPMNAEALKTVKANGFGSIEEFFNFMGRAYSAATAVSIQNNMLSVDTSEIEQSISSMKKSGKPAYLIKGAEESLNYMNEMAAIAKSAKPADVAAIKKYPQISKLIFPESSTEIKQDTTYDEYPDY